ncbi:MAG: hypothetical protein VW862_05265 [Euryarchaeota archaeon]
MEHSWSKLIPVRVPVEWEYEGEIGIHPELDGVTGKNVVFSIEKKFTKFEKILAKILRAPKKVRRTMQYICEIMESLYHEDIAPVEERVKSYLDIFIALNVVTMYKVKEEE